MNTNDKSPLEAPVRLRAESVSVLLTNDNYVYISERAAAANTTFSRQVNNAIGFMRQEERATLEGGTND